jgi:hypothetical protein
MVYYKHGVKLSPIQLRKIASGHRNKKGVSIRLSHSALKGGHVIPLTQRQITKIKKHHALRKGVELLISPSQIRGSGFKQFVRDYASRAVRYAGHKGVDYVADKVKGKGFFNKVLSSGIRGVSGALADQIGGSVKKRRKSKRKGKGFFNSLASGGVRLAGNTLADAIGGGIRKKRRTKKKGKGLFNRIASSGVRLAGNTLADAIGGGIRKRKTKKKGKGIWDNLDVLPMIRPPTRFRNSNIVPFNSMGGSIKKHKKKRSCSACRMGSGIYAPGEY